MTSRAYMDKQDIMQRYDCGVSNAMRIIHAVKEFNGGGALPKGKVLPSELAHWEQNRGRLCPSKE